MADSAVRFFAPDDPRLASRLKAKLKAQENELRQAISDGFATDHADYKGRCGVVAGLKLAAELCDQVEKELEQR